MKKSVFLVVAILFSAVLLGAGCTKSDGQPTEVKNQLILFVGDSCPHCAKVEQFLADNKVQEKISWDTLEVFNHPANAEVMVEKLKACGLPTDQIAVPMLSAGVKCYQGDADIINFFKQKLGLQ